ncbi:MAG: LacI family transcriptional regulator [Lachnospiraceae bacterium]|jgi:LacI family transcriptional regulator|nr:LacI family transcriptional regulator [Lachnospiraceae bacterium]MCI8997000.1 LacI family transcriptional regulator [Lachnospiraceae bacterium]MCI9134201.1 LacI family transcriptional regulator [Lachnospiraceae bacterium]
MGIEKRITIKELAERTGVSVGTVHCAIHGKKGVSEKTREMILQEARRCNFQLNENASLLRRGAQNVAVVLPKAQGEERYYFRGIWEGIRKEADNLQGNPLNFQYVESEYSLDEISQELMDLYDREIESIQGLITVSDDKDASAWARRFGRLGIPTVLISSYKKEESYVNSVKVDHEKAGKLAGEFLYYALQGKKGKILFLTGSNRIFSNTRYMGAFQKYMEEYCPEKELICVPGFGKEEIEKRVRIVLEKEKPLAAFACNARNTIHLCKLVEEYPDLSGMLMVGTDVFRELVPYFENGILTASIYQYNREQGAKAVEILYHQICGKTRDVCEEELPIGLVMKYNYESYVS